MPTPVLYPKVSLEMQTGKISRWLVEDGATVSQGQVIFEIENDKAAVEVEAPASGILRLLAEEGAEVEVGTEVARIASPGEDEPAAQSPNAPTAVASASETVLAAPAPQRSRLPNPTPLARRIAREKGIDLTGMAGTGPRGRIQKSDVLGQLAALAAQPREPVPASPGQMLNSAWLRRGEGYPVVLLHGFGADLNNWRGLLAGARVGFPMLALDLPAHGASPRVVPANIDAVCAQIEATLAKQIGGPVVLAGHSFGGAVAARLAARGAVDARGLCLFAPAGLGPQIDQAFIRGFVRARSEVSLRPWLEHLVHDPATISTAFVKAVAAQRQDQDLTAAMTDFADHFFPDGTQVVSVKSDLARLRIPVRVIFGKQDRVLPFATTRDLPPGVGLHALANCGHLPHLEQPELSLRLLTELWRSAA